jgi:hypothetical protein
MRAQGLKSTMIGSATLLLLVLRHIAAPFGSFAVSYATAFLLAIPIGFIGMSLGRGGQAGIDILHAAVGFCGVFSGARCLPQASRRAGSFVLLLLGLYYFCHSVAAWGNQISDEGKTFNIDGMWIVRLVFLAIGGLLATGTIWWSSSNKSLPPAAEFAP